MRCGAEHDEGAHCNATDEQGAALRQARFAGFRCSVQPLAEWRHRSVWRHGRARRHRGRVDVPARRVAAAAAWSHRPRRAGRSSSCPVRGVGMRDRAALRRGHGIGCAGGVSAWSGWPRRRQAARRAARRRRSARCHASEPVCRRGSGCVRRQGAEHVGCSAGLGGCRRAGQRGAVLVSGCLAGFGGAGQLRSRQRRAGRVGAGAARARLREHERAVGRLGGCGHGFGGWRRHAAAAGAYGPGRAVAAAWAWRLAERALRRLARRLRAGGPCAAGGGGEPVCVASVLGLGAAGAAVLRRVCSVSARQQRVHAG